MTTSLSPGYPIRLSGNHGMCASPPGFSQLTTAFFASQLPGIRHKPLSLDHIIFFAFRITPHRVRIRSSFLGFLPSAPRHTLSFLPSLHCQCPLITFRFNADFIYKNHSTAENRQMILLEIRGFEPLTLGLQSRCSSQLSYIPVI